MNIEPLPKDLNSLAKVFPLHFQRASACVSDSVRPYENICLDFVFRYLILFVVFYDRERRRSITGWFLVIRFLLH